MYKLKSSTMDFHALEDLKCSLCTNLLSYFPIYISTNNANICGRCAPLQENTPIRNSVYESVSQFLKFPCRYKSEGCLEILLPKDVPEHEKCCFYRVMKCPTCTQCNWEGTRPNLIEHCRNEHSDITLKNGTFEMDLLQFREGMNLLEHNEILLTVQLKFDQSNKMLQCAVYHLQNDINIENYSCLLTVKSSNRNVSVNFHSTCFENINFTELYLESLKSESSIVSGKITIGETVAEDESLDKDKMNMDMLSVLKCSLCSEFAIPPIHQCINEQSTICSDCKPRHVLTCNNCLESAETRNIGLDKIASLLNYPCKNRNNGCNVISKPDLMKNHLGFCQYSEFECPLSEYMKCDWRGFGKDTATHIETNHQSLIVSPKEELCKNLISRKMYCNVMKYANQMFRVVYVEIDRRFYWSVQIVGPFTRKFKYEIEVLDKTNSGERLLVKQACGPLVKRKHLLKNDKYYCYLHSDQIKRLVTSRNAIAFKVHIFRS